MKESYGEGVATHTGPESCGGGSNAMAEALTGVREGQVLSREILFNFGVPTLWDVRKATSDISLSRDIFEPCAVGDLVHARKHLTREPGDPMLALRKRVLEAALGSLRT